ncbi:penicillin-binding protein activator [Desulfatitalea alkaliphila]|uniref:Penicillin-binding protein activator n=1 Tax=Desulfatitalea alkaliphila TaxID=2929485 RepID=A0AA41R0Q2_9BACT|nr:penicillin-binding protein activator [Desulfatitalea alkaliphila]MCJ8500074.1 penicillin-binding protein activator [Desulfatitalea alkaliphila]
MNLIALRHGQRVSRLPQASRHRLWWCMLLCTVALVAGCAMPLPRPTDTVAPAAEPGDPIFQQADRFWRQAALDQAMVHFSRYLAHHPNGRHAPRALQRLGDIYQRRDQFEAARAFYLRVIEQYPDTEAADDARLAIIDLLIADGRPAEAMELADRLSAGRPAPEVAHTLWQRLYQLHAAVADTPRSAWYAYLLRQEGPEESRALWAERVEAAFARLEISDIEWLWDRVDDRDLRADLMYRYGALQAVAENDDTALEVLSAFRQAHPGHPQAVDAAAMVETLVRRLSFAPMTIGCLLPLSGSHETFGQRMLQAIEMALVTVSENDAVRPIRLVVEDTGSNERGAVQGVRALAEAGVGAILGPVVTASAAAREAQRLKVPMVTFTQRQDITEVGDYIFRHFITPGSQVRTLVNHFVNDMGLRRFAVLYPDETYGRTFMRLFWGEVARQGGVVMAAVAYDPEQTDFAATIARLMGPDHSVPADLRVPATIRPSERRHFLSPNQLRGGGGHPVMDPVARMSGLYHEDRLEGQRAGADDIPLPPFDVLFIPDGPRSTGLILPQLVYHDVQDMILAGTNLWHTSQLLDMARQFAQNAVLVDGFFKESRLPMVRRFVDGYRELYGADPGLVEAFAYDTARMLFEVLDTPDMRLRPQLRDALRQKIHLDGVTGATAFDHRGDALKTLNLLRIEGNRFVEIASP